MIHFTISDAKKKIREIAQYLVKKYNPDKVILIAVLISIASVNAEKPPHFTDDLTVAEQLGYATVRLEVELPDQKSRFGTGFFYSFDGDEKGTQIGTIVTNRHVVEGGISGHFFLTLVDSLNKPIHGGHQKISIDNFESHWIYHPDPNVDLAAMPIDPALTAVFKVFDGQRFITEIEFVVSASHLRGYKSIDGYRSMKVRYFARNVSVSLIAEEDFLHSLSSVEDILMVGYPNRLWDSKNNLPIYRSGITATHPAVDYNGKKEFLIDAAIFPGSSGSPVFLFYDEKIPRAGHAQDKIKLLGVLSAVYELSVTGDIILKPIPSRLVPVTNIPMNLGLVIKAERVKELGELVTERLAPK